MTGDSDYHLKADEFTFALVPSTENPGGDPVSELTEIVDGIEARLLKNDISGTVKVFEEAEYKEPGTYDYTLTEKSDNDHAGMIYDDTVYSITVDVYKDETEPWKLVSEVTVKKDGIKINENEIRFVNTCVKQETSVIISGSKKYDNGSLKDTQFTFKLEPVSYSESGSNAIKAYSVMTPSNTLKYYSYNESSSNALYSRILNTGIPMPQDGKTETTSTPAGFFQFGTIIFDREGTYVYRVTEVSGKEEGCVYDTTAYDVTVTVTRDEDGKLKPTVTLDGGEQGADTLEFYNINTIQRLEFVPEIEKEIEGTLPNDPDKWETFKFGLYTSERYVPGAYLPADTTAEITGMGHASFDPITITKAGSYEFVIREKEGKRPGYEYDHSEWTVYVDVAYDEGLSALKVTNVRYTNGTLTNDTMAVFKNEYMVTQTEFKVPVEKLLSGLVKPKDDVYRFTLSGPSDDGVKMPADHNCSVTGAGHTEFDPITFTKEGTYTFTVEEKNTGDPEYDFDESVWTVEIKVEDMESFLTVTNVTYKRDGLIIETDGVSFDNSLITGSVTLRKTDNYGDPVAGAVYSLYFKPYDGEENFVRLGNYTTGTDGTIHAEGLRWGSYYFKEIVSPRGLALNPDAIAFTVDQDTVRTDIVKDTVDYWIKGQVRLRKAEEGDDDNLLPGAEFKLYFYDGTECSYPSDYTVDGRTDGRIVTGPDGTVLVTGIIEGNYYFKEIVPPDNFELNEEPVVFSVTKENSETVQNVIAYNTRSNAILKVNKVINEMYEPFGTPTFIFTVTGPDGRTQTRSITIPAGEHEGSFTLTVEKGFIYTIKELPVSRYHLTSVLPVANIHSYDLTEGTAKADFDGNNYAEVTFRNEITQYEKFSCTDVVINKIRTP